MFDTMAELNAANGTLVCVAVDGLWDIGLGFVVGIWEDGVGACEGGDGFCGTASEGTRGGLEEDFEASDLVETGIGFAVFGFAGACAVACVDNSRTCSNIFDVFVVTVDFIRDDCDSVGCFGSVDTSDDTGLDSISNGFAALRTSVGSVSTLPDVLAFLVLVVVGFSALGVFGIFDFVLTSFATTSFSPTTSTATTFLGLPLFFGATTSTDIMFVVAIAFQRTVEEFPQKELLFALFRGFSRQLPHVLINVIVWNKAQEGSNRIFDIEMVHLMLA